MSLRSSSDTQDQNQPVICEASLQNQQTDKKEEEKEVHSKLPIKIKIWEIV